ncbi:MAG: SDR family NAD(P)-dependent oxidoreductase [Chloroflexota bacterium]
MKDKVCIVTGGNAGIGYEIVKSLASMQARVVMVCRNHERGQGAITTIQRELTNCSIDLVLGDLSTISSTKQLGIKLTESYPQIDVLIHNAGVWMTEKIVNEDGLEMSFMVNHLAPFILTQKLIPNLKNSAPSRIVHVNAGLYIKGNVDLAETPYGKDFGRFASYANSKLCAVLTLKEQTARLEGTGVTLNMAHPGVIQTGLGDAKGLMGWLLRQIKRTWSTPAEGAVAPVWLATDPELVNTTGTYFDEKQIMPLDSKAENEQLAKGIWQLSEELMG